MLSPHSSPMTLLITLFVLRPTMCVSLLIITYPVKTLAENVNITTLTLLYIYV